MGRQRPLLLLQRRQRSSLQHYFFYPRLNCDSAWKSSRSRCSSSSSCSRPQELPLPLSPQHQPSISESPIWIRYRQHDEKTKLSRSGFSSGSGSSRSNADWTYCQLVSSFHHRHHGYYRKHHYQTAHLINDTTKASHAATQLKRQQKQDSSSPSFLVYQSGADYHNARQLLTALRRRLRSATTTSRKKKRGMTNAEHKNEILVEWLQHQAEKHQQTSLLNRLLLLVRVEPNKYYGNTKNDSICSLTYRRAPPQLGPILTSMVESFFFGFTTTPSSISLSSCWQHLVDTYHAKNNNNNHHHHQRHYLNNTDCTNNTTGSTETKDQKETRQSFAYIAVPLREILGRNGANQAEQNGIVLPQLQQQQQPKGGGGVEHRLAVTERRIFPKYGVFAPTRHEYLDLILEAPLPQCTPKIGSGGDHHKGISIMDVGTGTGVITAMMLLHFNSNTGSDSNSCSSSNGKHHHHHRHHHPTISSVIATDSNPHAIACARENLEQLGLLVPGPKSAKVTLVETNIFPPSSPMNDDDDDQNNKKVDLIICNPPWIPAVIDDMEDGEVQYPSSVDAWLDNAVYDSNSDFLRSFLLQARDHLNIRENFETETTTNKINSKNQEKETQDSSEFTSSEVWLVLSDLAERLGLRLPGQVEEWIHEGGLEIVSITSKARHPTDELATTTVLDDEEEGTLSFSPRTNHQKKEPKRPEVPKLPNRNSFVWKNRKLLPRPVPQR